MMRALLLRLAPVLTCLALAACGGGGSSGGAAQPPDSASLRVQPASSTLGVNSLTDVVVTLERRGTGVPDGTPVTLSVDQANLGQVGAASGENQSFNNSATATTSGGQARFRFKSTTATGTATVRASANDGNSGQNVVSTANITLNGGPSNDTRLTLSADRTIIPINAQGVPPSCRSYPYQAEVTVTWRNLRGELVTAPEDEDAMRAAWTSPASVGAITTPDNPETEDVNECELFMASMGVPMNAGRGTIFVRSMQEQGTGTLTVSVVDETTGENLSAQMEFQISSGVPDMPGSVTVVAEGAASYVNTDRPIRIQVTDGAGSPVPNPQSGGTAWNNVRLEILDAEGERLRTTAADGSTQTGTSVVTRTANGIASAMFIAASRQDTIVLRATADRADNNVDNGITDPVVGEVSIVVSDGQLFSVTLTTPSESLFVNRPGIVTPGDDEAPLPPPDGTYSMTVSAIATDRGGNPVLPGTVLQFGLIDSPTSGFPAQGGGTFAIFGLNGDPQEGGTLFTSPTGAFTTAGGGAGPGDTLVLFGKDVQGNRDHEGARTVASVNSATSLIVTREFNRNDDTGQSVNSGPVIPYAIGRASIANIGASAATDENGVATTRFNYPVSQLGRNVILWVQGNADEVAGRRETAGDVEFYSFAGVGPGILTAAPSSITANQTAQVTVCLTDALNEPIQGVSIGFAFEGLTSGTGTADGDSGSGLVGPTDGSGCTSVRVATAGVEAGEGAETPQLRFFASGAEAVVEIVGGIDPEPEPDPDTVTLTINIEGEGDVRVSSSESGFSPPRPGGSALCTHEEAPCVLTFVEGTLVGLTALPDTGFDFNAWSGDCTGNAFNNTVTMAADRTCTARFVPE